VRRPIVERELSREGGEFERGAGEQHEDGSTRSYIDCFALFCTTIEHVTFTMPRRFGHESTVGRDSACSPCPRLSSSFSLSLSCRSAQSQRNSTECNTGTLPVETLAQVPLELLVRALVGELDVPAPENDGPRALERVPEHRVRRPAAVVRTPLIVDPVAFGRLHEARDGAVALVGLREDAPLRHGHLRRPGSLRAGR